MGLPVCSYMCTQVHPYVYTNIQISFQVGMLESLRSLFFPRDFVTGSEGRRPFLSFLAVPETGL